MRKHRFSAAVIALCLPLIWSARIRTQTQPSAAFQASPAATPVGSSACASCHQGVHAEWKSGRHSKMIQPAKAASIEGDFSQAKITLRGQPFQLRVANGVYFITESNITGTPREHRVEYTLGSRRIQHYLTTIENGRIIVLTPSWDVERREWFDNMEIVRPDEDARTPVQQWNKNCFGCHVSQQDNHYQPATHTYATAFSDFGTSCERCHGPGGAHVAQYRSGRGGAAGRSRHRPSDPARSRHQQHDLRAVPLAARHHRARLQRRRELLRSLSADPGIRTAQGVGPGVLGGWTATPFFQRRDGPLAERLLPARRRHLHQLSPRSAFARRVDKNPQLASAASDALLSPATPPRPSARQ